jgi:bifunctional non-homologous end joining protein LigD
MSPKPFRIARRSWLLFLTAVIPLAACHTSDKPSIKTFATPDDATNAVVSAAKSGDQAALIEIFGPDSKELMSSGDAVQDKNTGDAFVARYETMHRWRNLGDGAQMLVVGADNFAFPIPLRKNASGQWFFDTAVGKDEVLNRRVGRNELAVIEVCGAAADAQGEYFSQLHDGATTKQYAQKFLSDPGKHNGLYWASPEGQPQSPLGPLVAFATAEGYSAKPDARPVQLGVCVHGALESALSAGAIVAADVNDQRVVGDSKIKSKGKVTLYSRRGNDLTKRFDYIAMSLASLPDDTVIDGELVALDEDGKPSFNLLQNFRSGASHAVFYAFDILFHKGEKVMQRPLSERRAILAQAIQPSNHVSLSQVSDKAAQMLSFVRSHGLEGVVAKQADSIYLPGKRTGYWTKTRTNLAQEFVVGGYIPSNLGVDSIVVGFYKGKDLYYAARVRAGFVPATRRATFEAIKNLKAAKCPFVNLPEEEAGRWGQGLTAEKMKEAVWIKPKAVAQIEFLEWTDANHLRHTKFVGLRDDKDPSKVIRET